MPLRARVAGCSLAAWRLILGMVLFSYLAQTTKRQKGFSKSLKNTKLDTG
jgi:hypothetical protein